MELLVEHLLEYFFNKLIFINRIEDEESMQIHSEIEHKVIKNRIKNV